MAESLRDYFVRFLFRTDKSGAKEAQNQIEGLTKKLEKLGAASFFLNEITGAISNIVAPFRQLGAFVDQTAREADALGDLSERTGIATEKLQEYAFMAKMSGVESEALIDSVRKLEVNVGEAAAGSKEASEGFAKLGIKLRDANGHIRSTDELMPEIAKAFEKIPSHAEKSAQAVKLFGRAGQQILPFLAKGEAALTAMREELAALGGVTSKEFLAVADEYGDNMDRLAVVWRGMRQALAGPLIKYINELAQSFIVWWKASGELVRTRMSEWAYQLRVSFQALWDTARQFGGWILGFAALLNIPLLAMMGLHLVIALLIDDFANWMQGNDSLIGRAIANWDEWLEQLAKTHPTIAKILEAFGNMAHELSALAHDAGKDIIAFLLKPITDTMDRIENFSLAKLWDNAKYEATSRTDRSFGKEQGAYRWQKKDEGPGLLSQLWDNAKYELGMRPVGANVPGALAAARGGGEAGGVGSVHNQVSIEVNATPGMDEKQLAVEVGKQFDLRADAMMRQAFNAVVPESY